MLLLKSWGAVNYRFPAAVRLLVNVNDVGVPLQSRSSFDRLHPTFCLLVLWVLFFNCLAAKRYISGDKLYLESLVALLLFTLSDILCVIVTAASGRSARG